jgi:uncharacterized protein DUF4157
MKACRLSQVRIPTTPTISLAPARSGVLQRQTRNSKREARNDPAVPPIVREVLRSPGQPLDAQTRAFMEPRFGHDFSQVQVHAEEKASESATAVNARAYTVGRDVVFGAGQYASHTRAGRQLLAHELTHVVQQTRGTIPTPSERTVLSLDESGESEAAGAANAVVNGASFLTVTPFAPHTLQRQVSTPTSDEKKKSGEKQVQTQPPPQKVAAVETKKDEQPAAPEKKGVEAAVSVGGEIESKREQGNLKTEGSAKYTIEVTIPITDKLQVGRLSFVKEASIEASGGLKFTPDKGTLTNLEVQTAVKAISVDWEKVKVPLGIADVGVSASGLASAEYSPMERSGAVKFGIGAEFETKFKRSETSPFFIKVSGGVEKTYDKEGSANFKWSPLTWKAGATVGVEF